MHQVQGAETAASRGRTLWSGAEKVSGMQPVHRVERFVVPLLPLQAENQTPQPQIKADHDGCSQA